MFCWSKPGRGAIEAFLTSQRDAKFSYDEVGSSLGQAPAGYTVDHNRTRLGRGSETFELARRAIRQWKMFEMSWVKLCWPGAPIEACATVAILISHLGFWSLNASRIVYVIEERGVVEKFGFAYGTLVEHGEIGEERFTVELNSADQTVWYDIYAFSRPGALARWGYPYTRALQRRFARESMAAMVRAVGVG